MLTKGIIQAIDQQHNTCTIRIPLFETAGNKYEFNAESTIAISPGVFNGYNVGDVVIIGFENDRAGEPIILGKLYLGSSEEANNTAGSIYCNNITVEKEMSIPIDTKINFDTNANNYTQTKESTLTGFSTLKNTIDEVIKNRNDINILKSQGVSGDYIKDAHVSQDGNTLTLTKKDDTNIVFSPETGGGGTPLDTDVKLSAELKTYYNIGKITTASGTNPVTIGNAGDSIRDVLNNLTQMDEQQPSITSQPAISSFSLSSSESDEYGTQISSIDYSISTSQGSYTYEPSPTGVSWTKYNLSGGCESIDKTSTSGTIALTTTYIVGTPQTVSITCTGTHTAGNIAKTNLGNNSNPEIKIQAGTKSKSASFSKTSKLYPYYMLSNSETLTTVAKNSATKSTESACTNTGISITADENTYVWFILPPSYTYNKIQYEALGQWYDWSAGTSNVNTVTITLNSDAIKTGYKAYRINSKMAVGTTKFRIIK